MITTDKKHWVNGHQVRGGFFHTVTFQLPLTNKAVMISWGQGKKAPAFRLKVKLYKLV